MIGVGQGSQSHAVRRAVQGGVLRAVAYTPISACGCGFEWKPEPCLQIVRGERMNEKIPNDSMSIIHAADLAALHVVCLPLAGVRRIGDCSVAG